MEKSITAPRRRRERNPFAKASDEVLLHILRFLPATSVLQLALTERRWSRLCQDELVWKALVRRDFAHVAGLPGSDPHSPLHFPLASSSSSATKDDREREESYGSSSDHRDWKRVYFDNQQTTRLTDVRWHKALLWSDLLRRHRLQRLHSLQSSSSSSEEREEERRLFDLIYCSARSISERSKDRKREDPVPREGHAMVAMADALFLFGGFQCDDEVYCLQTRMRRKKRRGNEGGEGGGKDREDEEEDEVEEEEEEEKVGVLLREAKLCWRRLPLVDELTAGERPGHRYGHTLTAIGPSRFLLFGGMTQGGYSGELNDLWLLTIHPSSSSSSSSSCATTAASAKKLDEGAKERMKEDDKKMQNKKDKKKEKQKEKKPKKEKKKQKKKLRTDAAETGTAELVLEYEDEEDLPPPPFFVHWQRLDESKVQGTPPAARGYHSAALSPNGQQLFIYGGIGRARSLQSLAIFDIPSMSWLSIEATKDEEEEAEEVDGDEEKDAWRKKDKPGPRFGHSCHVIGEMMYFVGGGVGNDLLRDGHDFDDVFVLDPKMLAWSRLEIEEDEQQQQAEGNMLRQGGGRKKDALGRCHCAVAIGDKIVCFGGGKQVCNQLCVLDVGQRKWVNTKVHGRRRPPKRQSAQACFLRGWIWMWGGFSPLIGAFGDLHLLQLADARKADGEKEEEEGEEEEQNVDDRFVFHGGEVDLEGVLGRDRCLLS
ncbi:Leucine-zipper-like transcriptional regulator 1 [Balamuthia mandrillaris]